ncbi:MAG TPA: hypothetical protein VM779_10720 [Thermoanaerobaculia bacterium]|nr:hypothetical protein [Thermoanaerobaculia bacterium]
MSSPDLQTLFHGRRYRFTPGMPAGEVASIADGGGRVLLTYRSFASVVGIVAALVIAIVLVTGVAAALFLAAEERPGAAMAAVLLAFTFAAVIAALVPRTRVTLYHDSQPALRIVQRSRLSFPETTWAVRTDDGTTLATIRKGALSRLSTNRWTISTPPDQSGAAYAAEESFGRALLRKILGKFRRRFEANMRVIHNGLPAAVIIRRPDEQGEADYLELAAGADLDPRVAVALATLVFGSEP